MKKRLIHKIVKAILLLLVVCLAGFKLYKNKSRSDEELAKLISYEQVVPVHVTTAQTLPVEHMVEESGIFRSFREIDLVSETHGLVLNLYVNTGDYVSRGETLALVEKQLAEQALALAELKLQNAEEDLHRFQKLSASEAVTLQQYEQIKLNYQNSLTQVAIQREQLDNTKIIAPVDGYISSRCIEAGSYISPGMFLMKIAQQQDLVLETFVDGNTLTEIKEGSQVQVFPSTGSSGPLKGIVHEVAVENSLSGRYRVSVMVHNKSRQIKPGMTGKVQFPCAEKESSIILPRTCLINSLLDPCIYVLSGNKVIRKNISASLLNETQILVQGGLTEGELVVVSGLLNLSPGTQVRIIN